MFEKILEICNNLKFTDELCSLEIKKIKARCQVHKIHVDRNLFIITTMKMSQIHYKATMYQNDT